MFYSHLAISLPFLHPVELLWPLKTSGAVILPKVGYEAQVWAGMSIPSSLYLVKQSKQYK